MNEIALAEKFQHYFDTRVAHSSMEHNVGYRLRHRVYCDEFHYVHPRHDDNGLERDEYDPYALHVLLNHRPTGMPAGYFRLLVNSKLPTDWQLPFERFCSDTLYDHIIDPRQLPANSYAELSRLAVPSLFRRRHNEQYARVPIGDNHSSEDDSRNYPLITMALLLSAGILVEEMGVEYLFAMLEPRVARLLRQHEVPFYRIGNLTEYHGVRAPFFMRTHELKDRLSADSLALASTIQAQLTPATAAVH